MALAESTCEILKVCKPLIQENRESIGQTFYEILFEKHPSLQGMFNMSHFRKDGDKPGRQVKFNKCNLAFMAYFLISIVCCSLWC